MTSLLTSTPPKATAAAPSSSSFETTRFVHKFGYHFAKQLLGASTVNKCIKKGAESLSSLQKVNGSQSNQYQSFRANWRGPSTKFPWELLAPESNHCWNVGEGTISPDSLFLDVTFGFLVFPYEVTEEGRTAFCHVVKSEEWDEEYRQGKDNNEFISLSVAIRIGALIAIPSNNNNVEKDDIIISSSIDNVYQYYYQRGNPLCGTDIYEHCRSVDIVPEEMDATQIADIIANAFCNDNARILVELSDTGTTTNASFSQSHVSTIEEAKTRQWCWKLELNHKELEGKGTLPLKAYDHNQDAFSKAYNDKNWGTPIDYSILDAFLLNNQQGQRCVALPATEAKLVWDQFDPTLLESLKEPVKPSPRRVLDSKPAAINPYAKKPSPPTAEENKSNTNTKPKIRKASPIKRETAIFAKGKRTTIAGSKRKKPTFTIGPK